MKPIAWIGIGCGAIILIAVVVVLAAGIFVFDKASDFAEEMSDNPAATIAENIVRLNPDLELVESDREGGKITILDKESGDEITLNYEDIQHGRFSLKSKDGGTATFDASAPDGVLKVETDEGTTTFGATGSGIKLPSWLPAYENLEGEAAGFTSITNEVSAGTVGFKTTDKLDKVMKFFDGVLSDLGLEASRGSFSTSGTETRTLSGSSETHNLHITGQTSEDGKTSINIVFSGPA